MLLATPLAASHPAVALSFPVLYGPSKTQRPVAVGCSAASVPRLQPGSEAGVPDGRRGFLTGCVTTGGLAATAGFVLQAGRQRRKQQRGSSTASLAAARAPLLEVASGADTTTVPIWLFRQAGRHLPEYMAYKEKRQKNFLQLLDDPEDVAEVTMQPLRRYNLDAGILFSDILVVPQAMGIRVEMPGGKGITVPEPLRNVEDIGMLPSLDEVSDPSWVRSKLSHVMEAVRAIKHRMHDESRVVPLIGFSAAPWTLLFYMVGGSSRKETDAGERWLAQHGAESQQLLDLLTSTVIEYLSAQVESGCEALQVFEAMCDFISEDNFCTYALPTLERIAAALRLRHPGVPLMVFARGAGYATAALQRAGYNIITVDCKMTLAEAEAALVQDAEANGLPATGQLAGLQGNLDPRVLRPSEGGTVEGVRAAARDLLAYRSSARCGLIANLGEGLIGKEDPKLVATFVDAVHEISAELKSAS